MKLRALFRTTRSMSDYLARKAELRRMEAAARITSDHLASIARQIETAALASAASRSRRASVRTYFGHSLNTRWGGPDRKRLSEARQAISEIRASEVGALQRRLERQLAAIAAFRTKHGINEPVPYGVPPISPAMLRAIFEE